MTTTSDCPLSNTDHGLQVAFGEFLQQHGWLERLRQIPIRQRTRQQAPGAKLVE
jgi:hypothetical protein